MCVLLSDADDVESQTCYVLKLDFLELMLLQAITFIEPLSCLSLYVVRATEQQIKLEGEYATCAAFFIDVLLKRQLKLPAAAVTLVFPTSAAAAVQCGSLLRMQHLRASS
jgi:hypothetical protein